MTCSWSESKIAFDAGYRLRNAKSSIDEIHDGDYSYPASRIVEERLGMGEAACALLVDNSVGIVAACDKKSDNEEGRRWVGELNMMYKATRAVTPTPVLADDYKRYIHVSLS